MTHYSRGMGAADILLGDFNALRREDYDDMQWDCLLSRAKKHKWAPPCDSSALSRLEKAGFCDVALAAGKNTELTAHVSQPLYRIDYCFVRGFGDSDGDCIAFESEVLRHVDCSDHFPVKFDINFLNITTGGGKSYL